MNSLPTTVTRQRRGCDLNPGPSAPESSTLTTRLASSEGGCLKHVPDLSCPTTSAMLPRLTLVMKAPSRPAGVILPPVTFSPAPTVTHPCTPTVQVFIGAAKAGGDLTWVNADPVPFPPPFLPRVPLVLHQ